MRAGTLRHRVTLQTRSVGVDALGQELETWNDLATVWASVSTKRGREYFAAGSVQAEASVVFRIRYRSDILMNSTMLRLLWRGSPYDIIEPPLDVDGRGQMIDLFASTGARDGR